MCDRIHTHPRHGQRQTKRSREDTTYTCISLLTWRPSQYFHPLKAAFSALLVPGWRKKPGLRVTTRLQLAYADTCTSQCKATGGKSAGESKQGNWQASELRASRQSRQRAGNAKSSKSDLNWNLSAESFRLLFLQMCNWSKCILCVSWTQFLTAIMTTYKWAQG